jgi:hypothetical protein
MELNKGMPLTHRFAECLLGFLVFSALACRKAEPQSPIVEKVRMAGAGDVASASESGTEEWLRRHIDLAVQVNSMCEPIRQNATAEWQSKTEGKVCVAARNAAMSTYRSPRDSKSYHPNQ